MLPPQSMHVGSAAAVGDGLPAAGRCPTTSGLSHSHSGMSHVSWLQSGDQIGGLSGQAGRASGEGCAGAGNNADMSTGRQVQRWMDTGQNWMQHLATALSLGLGCCVVRRPAQLHAVLQVAGGGRPAGGQVSRRSAGTLPCRNHLRPHATPRLPRHVPHASSQAPTGQSMHAPLPVPSPGPLPSAGPACPWDQSPALSAWRRGPSAAACARCAPPLAPAVGGDMAGKSIKRRARASATSCGCMPPWPLQPQARLDSLAQ